MANVDLNTLSISTLVVLFNEVADKPVNKFSTKAEAVRRTDAALTLASRVVVSAPGANKYGVLVVPVGTEVQPVVVAEVEVVDALEDAAPVGPVAPVSITAKEREMLRAVVESDFQDGEAPVGNHVWADCLWTHLPKASNGGVLASVIKKGLVSYDEQGRDSTVSLTALGLVSYVAAPAATPAEAAPVEAAPVEAAPVEAAPVSQGARKRGPAPRVSDDSVITSVVANPRRPSAAGFARFALYRVGMTTGEYIRAAHALQGESIGRWRGDVIWDLEHGFITVSEPSKG